MGDVTVLVSRDPFTRTELHRQLIPRPFRLACGWCGRPAKFIYAVHHDAGRIEQLDGQFCSTSCMKEYHA